MADQLIVGDRIRDNDPRMKGRVLTVTQICPRSGFTDEVWVYAVDSMGKERRYIGERIHTDNKLRRTGFARLVRDGDSGEGES